MPFNDALSPSRVAPWTGFDGVLFAIRPDDESNLGYPDWTWNVVESVTHIPGSNVSIRQVMGTSAATTTYSIEVDSRKAYLALQAKLNVTGDLRLVANMQSIPGATRRRQNVTYEVLGNITLTALTDRMFFPDGTVQCRATFMAPINPVTGGTS